MKARKLFALLLVVCMVVSLFPAVYAAEEAEVTFWDLKNTENVSTEELAITVDGEATKVTHYNGYYYNENEENTLTVGPGKYGPGGDRDDCQISIYVPEGATEDSAVMFLIENGSWAQTGYKKVIAEGQEFDSTGNDRVALALAYDMIVVSYGARCRGSVDKETGEIYIHAPQMVADTKAAIRYVKYNIGLGNIPGDADKVIISGHSGGGALTAIIAATGNSPDFDEYLVNAAPASDDVLATMSSAPITDLAYADFAYEWTFGDYRTELPDFLSYKEKGCDLELSAALAARYVPYVESMFGLTEEEYTAKIAEIFAASVQHEIDLVEEFQFSDIRPETDERGFFTLDENGDVASFDLDAYTKWLVNNASQGAYPGNEMKGVIAFNGEKVDGGYMRNENNLWGAADQVASVAYEELWEKANLEAMGIDAYESWDAFWAAEGEMLAKQMKSVSVMPYLTGSDDAWYLEGVETSDECDVAPYWFIRHGMGDADTSYAPVVSLMLAAEAKAEDVNAYFGWERSHNGGGNTYYQEFFQWIEDKGIIGDPFSVEYAEEANTLNITVDGEAVTVERYNDYYYSAAEGDTTSVGPGKYGPGGDRDDCQLSIYVPDGATAESGVMFLIENGSWAQTGFKEVIADGQAFDSTQNDRVALALAHDMIVVSYGARCRGSVDAEGNRIHAPQMVVDTKAAIRYVKYNIEQGLIPGDADKVIISGHSGGGALTAIIAATGNSPDFDEYLVNAAPASDDVLATMSSAPITDLAYADFAYEWTFGDYRTELPDFLSYKEKGCDLELSAALAAKYVPYVESMFGLTEEEYTAKIAEIFAASVQHEIDLAEEFQFSDIRPETDERGFFTLDENGDVASFDLDAYTKWLVNNASQGAYPGNEMKGVIAFNGEKVDGGYMRNENNLWGAADQVASVAYEELWEKANLEAMGIDAYESWDAFWAAEGEMVAKQMKSVSVMPYLTGSDDAWYLEGVETSDESDVAPYWFIRHGMGDADTSYATVASLIMAVEEKAEHVNAYFGWERSHNGGGNTYYAEFFQWMEDEGVLADPDLEVALSSQAITVKGEAVEAEIYNINGNNYFKLRDIAALLVGTHAEFGVDFDNEAKEVYIDTDGKYEAVGGELEAAGDKSETCVVSKFAIIVDGEAVDVAVYNIGGNNYFKLRDLASVVGFTVDYDAASRTIEIL